jgi:hypothetical protein
MMRKHWVKLFTFFVISIMVFATAGYIGAGADNTTSLSITAQPLDTSAYAGSSVVLSVSATGGGSIKYQWYSNTKNKSTGGVSIPGGTGSSYTPATTAAGTQYYYCTVYRTGTAPSTVTTRAAAVVIKPLPKITSQPAGATAYTGDAVTLSVQASGSGALTYQWYSIADNSKNGAVALADATRMQYTASTAATGTIYYYCVVTNTDNTMTGMKTASVTSSMAKVVVNAVSTTAPVITAQPLSVSVYTGASAKLVISAVGSGTLRYQWYRNTSSSISNADAIDGAVSTVYTAATAATGSTYYYCVVTNTTEAGVYTSTSSIAACTVKAAAAITVQPAGTMAFVGDTVKLSVEATGSSILSYQWYSNTKSSASGGVKISGATSAAYTPSTQTSGIMYYYCIVTNTDSAITGIKTSAATSAVVQVAVVVEHESEPTIKTQPSSSVAYAGSAVKLMIAAIGSGSLSYQWYSTSESSASTGTAVSGATDSAYTVPAAAEGTTYFYCVVSNTVATVTGPKTLTAVSSIAGVTGKPLPAITAQPAGTSAYIGDTVTLSIGATGSGALTYQWFSNTKNSTSGSMKIAGATKTSFSPSTKKADTTYYYCVVTNTDSSITGTKTAGITSRIAQVVVKPVYAAAPTITVKPANAAVIAGAPASLSIKATGTGTLSYQWYSNTKNSAKGAAAISGATDTSYSVTSEAAGTTYYYCVVTNTDSTMPVGKTASVTSNIVSVTVKLLTPVINKQPVSSTVLYKGGSLTLSISAAGSGTLSYQWYRSTDMSGAAGTAITKAISAKYALAAAAEGTAYYYCVVTNTVKTDSGIKTGTAMSNAAAVTVKPTPVITSQPAGMSAYIGDTVALSLEAAGSGTLSYQWYCNTKNSLTGGRKISGAVNTSFSPPTSKTGTTYYYCIVKNTDSSITGTKTAAITSSIVQVAVKPVNAAAPVITKKPVSAAVKAGDSVSLSVRATGAGTLSYQWYSNTKNSTTGAAAISGATSETYTVKPSAAGSTYYYCVITNTDNSAPGIKTASVSSSIVRVTRKA